MIPFRTRYAAMWPHWLATFIAGYGLASVAEAQHRGAPTPRPAAEKSDGDIVVTGRALPGAVIGDIPPENRLSAADVAAYGVSTINELLDAIADQTQSDQGRDSGSAPVILVNGKRVSGVNEVGDLPTEAVLRVDILPEEVALKYGYDAQRKVVNIILRRRFAARVADTTAGLATEGQGKNGAATLSYVRIHDNDRFSLSGKAVASAALRQSDRDLVATTTAIDPQGDLIGDTAYRTLRPATQNYTLNGTYAHRLSDALTASFNLRGSYQTSDALTGLAATSLTIPATSPFAQDDAATTIDRFLTLDALHQRSTSATVHGGVTLNANLSRSWQLSLIGAFDHSDTRTITDAGYDIAALRAAIAAGDANVDPYGPLPTTLLGPVLRRHATAIGDSASGSVVAMGKLLTLPAGAVRTSLRIGGGFSTSTAENTGTSIVAATRLTRSELNAQASLDVPLTSAKTGFLGAVGTLSANINVGAKQLSDYGALGTFGYGLNWTPRKGISVIVSMNEDRNAPTLEQLNAPTVTTANVLVYDYARGKTVAVTQISGGTSTLVADDRHVFKASVSAALLARTRSKLTLSASYIHSRTENAIGTLPTLSAAVAAAFPDRYVRDASGSLLYVDTRAINFAREERSELRSGLTFTQILRAPKRPRPPWDAPPPFPGAARGDTPASPKVSAGTAPSHGEPSGAEPTEPAQADGDEVVVEGRRAAQPDTSPPPPPPGDFDGDGPPPGPPPEGMGPPPGGFGGPPGGPGGGPGGPGGFGPGGPGGDNAVRLQLSLFHSWYFRDQLTLRDGGATLDLLDGGSTGTGGQPRHAVQFDAGIVDNGLGLRLSGHWKSATRVDAAADATGTLRFSSLATFDVRLFANLEQRFPGQSWARGTRISIAVGNLLDARQSVRDGNGATPALYQAAAIDPLGRTLSVSLRRLF